MIEALICSINETNCMTTPLSHKIATWSVQGTGKGGCAMGGWNIKKNEEIVVATYRREAEKRKIDCRAETKGRENTIK